MNQNPISDAMVSTGELWRTAGVLDRTFTRQYVSRLSDQGIDHTVTGEGEQLRISVRREDLDAALSLRPQGNADDERSPKLQPNYLSYMRMLFTIPVGAFLGTAITNLADLPFNWLPAGMALGTAIVVEVFAQCRD